MAGRIWTQDQDRQLVDLYPNTPMPELIEALGRSSAAIYNRADKLKAKRSPEYLAGPNACRLRRDDNPGIEWRFKPGQAPWNAGKQGWTAGGRSAETRFKAGNKPHTWVPIGAEQIRKGYLWRKVTDFGGRHDWRPAHHLAWEQHNGPMPSGHIITFKDRNAMNFKIENLELITRAENARRNSIHRYPPELKAMLRLQKKLERTIEASQ